MPLLDPRDGLGDRLADRPFDPGAAGRARESVAAPRRSSTPPRDVSTARLVGGPGGEGDALRPPPPFERSASRDPFISRRSSLLDGGDLSRPPFRTGDADTTRFRWSGGESCCRCARRGGDCADLPLRGGEPPSLPRCCAGGEAAPCLPLLGGDASALSIRPSLAEGGDPLPCCEPWCRCLASCWSLLPFERTGDRWRRSLSSEPRTGEELRCWPAARLSSCDVIARDSSIPPSPRFRGGSSSAPPCSSLSRPLPRFSCSRGTRAGGPGRRASCSPPADAPLCCSAPLPWSHSRTRGSGSCLRGGGLGAVAPPLREFGGGGPGRLVVGGGGLSSWR